MVRSTFAAMGTTVGLHLDAPAGEAATDALDRATAAFRRVETVCTRFGESSELSTLNRLGSGPVSSLLAEVVELALAGRDRTGGLFDPTVHDAVVAAGYDRDFSELVRKPDVPERGPSPAGGRVVIHGDRVVLGAGTRLDLGGIAKGYAVDRACAILAEVGPCLVDAGGDIGLRGTWAVGVEDGPTLELTDCAVATSGRDRRRWHTASGTRHHLIDPSTGRPAATDTLRATVVAPTAVEAEVLAKAAFLGGRVDAPTVRVLDDGEVRLEGRFG
jgi:thiamine biosynthesis lipoprotein